MDHPEKKHYDIVIMGGGLAGLTCALQSRMEAPDATIAVLEKVTHPVSEAAHKIGESSVEVGAHYYRNVLGLEEHLEKDQIPKMGLRLFFDRGDNSTIENRLEVGGTDFPPFPSYQFDRGRLENYLGERCLAQGIDFIDGATIKEVEIGRKNVPHEVSYEKEGQSVALRGRWVVDASGRAGILKRKFGLKQECDHNANSAWIRINKPVRVDEWSDDPEWGKDFSEDRPRWQSTNHFLGQGYWIWIIPLASGATSIGVVADAGAHPLSDYNSLEKFLAWIDRKQPRLGRELRENESLVMDFCAIKRYSMECRKVFSADRWAIVGDAGFFIDPFYSPGNDFIALANTFTTDLIRRDLEGKWIGFHAPLYHKLYHTFFDNTGTIFKENYALFGNHQVMPVKIVWDWLVYWSVTGQIFIHGRLCRTSTYIRHQLQLRRLNLLNCSMQEHFRRWHEEKPSWESQGLIDTSELCLLMDTNRGLLDDLDDEAFARRFAENVARLETLFWEIIEFSGMPLKKPFKRRVYPGAVTGGFDRVFEISGRRPEEGAGGEDTIPGDEPASGEPAFA